MAAATMMGSVVVVGSWGGPVVRRDLTHSHTWSTSLKYGPCWGPSDKATPPINLGYPKRDHNFENGPQEASSMPAETQVAAVAF